MRGLRAMVAIATLAAAVVAGSMSTAGAATKVPRWVKHVRNYPGGISNGVRQFEKIASTGGAIKPTAQSLSVTDVQVNDDTDPGVPQNETAVAASNDSTAVAMSNDYVSGGLYIGTTHDYGNTWKSFRITPREPNTGDFCNGGDPSVVYSKRDATFYASQLCFFRSNDMSGIHVLASRTNGDTWTPARFASVAITNVTPGPVTDPSVFYDKELLAVDNNPSSAHYGRVYLTFVKFHIQPNGFGDYCPVKLAYTDDPDPNNDNDLTDAVWSHSSVVPDNPGGNGKGPSANQFAIPVVDENGGVDVVYALEDCNSSLDGGIRFRRSTNGGASFGAQVKVNKNAFTDNPDTSDLLAPKNARIPISLTMAYNPVTDTLGVMYQNNWQKSTNGADITFQRSTDFGATWSTHKRVNDDATNRDQFFPWVAVNPSGDWVAIWYDNRNDPANLRIETFRGASSNNGATWVNGVLSDDDWDPNISFFSSGAFIGDYNGLAIGTSGFEFPVWADGRDSPGAPHGDTDLFTVPI